MRIKLLGLAGLILGSIPCTFGSVITSGQFSFGGTIFVTNALPHPVVTPAGTCAANVACIFWLDGAGTHSGELDITSTGNTTGQAISGNDALNVSTLTNPPDVVGSFPNVTFMSFNNGGVTTTFMLNTIFPGIDSPADCLAAPVSGDTCTPPGSFVNFQNNPPPSPGGTPCGTGCEATASFAFQGVTAGNPNPQEIVTFNFTSQFPLGTPYQSVLEQLATNGFVSNTFSGTAILSPAPTVPEPGSLLMIGSGLIGLAVFLRRRATVK
jgi:hypothetical protein